jgi:hypothetical protein
MNQQELLDRLFELAPPPDHPVNATVHESDWKAVESTVGTKLPVDYKNIINRYGSGDFCDLLILLNPFCVKDDLNLLYQVGSEPELYGPMLESYNEGRFGAWPENCPFSVYPEPGGLLPLACDSNGRDYFWLTEGEPDAWTIIRYDWRGGWDYKHFESSVVEFLVEWIGGELTRISERPETVTMARFNPVFCPMGQVRDYKKS